MPHSLRARWKWAVASLLTLAVLVACGENGPASTPSPTPTFDIPTPGGNPSATPTPPAPPSDYRLLYREFAEGKDTIWRVNPSEPAERKELAVIPHRAGWGIVAALSPDGKFLAYNSYPEEAFDPAFQADTHLIDLATGKSALLAEHVDLRLRPLWSPDGKLLYLRRFVEQDTMVLQVDLTPPKDEDPSTDDEAVNLDRLKEPGQRLKIVLRADVSDILNFTPLGFSPDGQTLYVVEVLGPGDGGGTVVGTYGPATFPAISTATAIANATATAIALTPVASPTASPTPTPTPLPYGEFLVDLSDEQTALDFDLSPDSRRLAFLVQELSEGSFLLRAFVADLQGREVKRLSDEGLGGGDRLQPAWHPDGERIALGRLPSGGEPGAVAIVSLKGGKPSFLPPPGKGFDVPQNWSPDGLFLAVTSFEGDSLVNPGKARFVLIAKTGQRIKIADGADAEVLAWVPKG